MDEADRQRFLEALRTDEEFRASVRRELLTQELLDLPAVVASLSASVNALVDHGASMQRGLDSLTERVDSLTERVDSLAQSAAQTQEDLRALVGTTRDLLLITQRGFDEMRGDLATLRSEVREIRRRPQ